MHTVNSCNESLKGSELKIMNDDRLRSVNNLSSLEDSKNELLEVNSSDNTMKSSYGESDCAHDRGFMFFHTFKRGMRKTGRILGLQKLAKNGENISHLNTM